MSNDRFFRLSPVELAAGWVPGHLPPRSRPERLVAAPVEALEDALRDALGRPPCMVSFSGGRDSSVVLAAAVRVARRDGLALPVPVTKVFPAVPETDETPWQELVLRHVRVDDWMRLEFDAELDLVGPVAAEGLRRHGVLWPVTVHMSRPLLEAARGGTLVTGEGGDEVFGRWRVAAVTQLLSVLAGRRRPPRGLWAEAAVALGPRSVRRRAEGRALSERAARPWLRPAAQQEFLAGVVRDAVEEPLRWDASLRRALRRRATVTGLTNMDAIAADTGVRYVHPLLDERFVEALAAVGGWRGFPSRTSALRACFAGLVPDEVLSRRTKASFNATALNRHSRDFIGGWSGEGVDQGLVDVDALRETWASPMPHAGSLLLLQAAWLAEQRVVPVRHGTRGTP